METNNTQAEIGGMGRWTSPNGAEWSVVTRDGGTVTMQLERTPDGHSTTLRNEQKFSAAELDAGDGWARIR